MSVKVFYDILNQRSTPAIYTDTIANRPAFGFNGRLFISTDSGQIFEDTGSAWTLVADAGVGGGTLSSVCLNGNTTASGIVITAGGLSSNSITNTGNTAGSVLFAGASGLESQSNSTFFWDNTNKRLGIGNASPGAPLDIHGTGTQLQINGTGSSNSYLNFQQAGTNKWRVGLTYSAGANYFDIFDNNSSVSRLSILNSGFIGAGTITPKEKLEVAGAVFSTGTNSNLGNFTGVVMDVYNPGTLQTGRIAAYDPAGSNLVLSTNKVGFNSAAALFINKDGQVSVAQDNSGSTNYGSFKVGVDASNMAITWNDLSSGYGYLGTGTGYAYVGTGGQLAFLRNLYPYTGGSIEMARFDLNGNFGIGTNSPSYTLDVRGTGRFTNSVRALSLDVISASGVGTSPASGLARFITAATTDAISIGQSNNTRTINLSSYYIFGNGNDNYCGTTSAHDYITYTNSAERMRITSGGELQVAYSGGAGYIRSQATYTNTSANVPNMYVGSAYEFGRGTASSMRYKENIADWDGNGLNTILALQPKTFTYKEEYYKHPERVILGLIAEEVAETCKYLADYENEDGSGEVENVRYAYIVVPLIKAIQEQQAIITSLQDRLDKAGL